MALVEFRLPQFGMGMQDGTIVGWLKAVGDTLVEDEPLLELETAKSVVEVNAPRSGVLRQICVVAGENVPIQTVLALIETED